MSDENEPVQPNPSISTDWESAASSARKEAAQYRKQVRDLEARLAEVESGSSAAAEAAAKAARSEVESAAEARVAAAQRSNRILSAAIGKVVDPAAAEKLLDLDALGSSPSDEDITKALDDLVASKSYLKPANGLGRDTGSGMRESVSTSASGNKWFDEARKKL